MYNYVLMALPQQGTETSPSGFTIFTSFVLMALPQQGTETMSKMNALFFPLKVLMALPQQGTETHH